ncbi:MAG: glycerol-3-phosphate dehydrogenase/oxidase, partial [Blastocatellia bacterium]|nr:glycerol-3-phosphate dehydrogenase/oxidase [Blastocatellia bacterium]
MKITEALPTRSAAIAQLQRERFDLLVIGGGITGAGVAQDAASRGLKVALVERGDFAVGTSSRSSKLIHGGLRYLAQGNFKVTYESCEERALLQTLAPHLVQPRSFLVPVYNWKYAIQLVMGLWAYDIVSRGKKSPFHKRINVSQAKKLAPMLKTDGLICAYIYHDCKTNDARLVLEVIKSAASYGAIVANYVEVKGFIKNNGDISGVVAYDSISDQEVSISADMVINATGVWVDKLRRVDDPKAELKVKPAKGTHITIARNRIPTDNIALLFESGINDGRSLFFIPWYEGTIIGTTDTEYNDEIDSPHASQADIDYILNSVRRIFPQANITAKDILSSYAGLRPLIDEGGKSTKDISREHKTFDSQSGLISIAGGKLTTYRRMASSAVDYLFLKMRERGVEKKVRPSITASIALSGIDPKQPIENLKQETIALAKPFGVEEDVCCHLVEDYGANAKEVLAIVAEQTDQNKRLVVHLPFIQAEVIYAVRAEQAVRI